MPANAKKRKRINKETSGNYLLYAVSKGKTTGLFINWLTCNESTNGVKGATFKGFNSLDEAKQYLEEAGAEIKLNGFTENDLKDKLSSKNSKSESEISSIASEVLNDYMDMDKNTSLSQNTPSTSKVRADASSDTQERISKLEEIVRDQSSLIASIFDTSRMECNNNGENNVQSKTQACQNCAQLKAQLNLLNTKILQMESTHNQLLKSIEESNSRNISIQNKLDSFIVKMSGNPNSTTQVASYHDALMGNTNPSQPKDSKVQHKVAPSKRVKHSLPTQNSPTKTSIFNWKKCVVLESNAKDLNKDSIRIGICKQFGPTDIGIINRYDYHSNKPDKIRFMLQIENDEQREFIVKNWSPILFGGSTARQTKSKPMDTAIIPGVPLEFSEDDIVLDVNREYRAICVKRLTNKEGQPLRAVIVQFQSKDERDKAFQVGKIKLPSLHNIILPIKLPNDRRRSKSTDDEEHRMQVNDE